MERAEDEEEDTEYHLNGLMDTEDVGAGRASLQDAHRNPKRKRRRKKKADAEGRVRRGASGGGLDPEDLPKRARWTIIATACLLLLMSVLLVGVTLRMAPIIDEMVRKENEEMVNAISREEGNEYNNTAKGVTVGSSPMPLSL
ncbi:uncharacterized protein LOC111872198 isoform X2 [Cryptotermes secundus]|uniref:uncharacterized protein LOC111872198 isoform X2 n=1 Tax=Cryptotermes secundus TaxID=105785 RepID=UPI001454C2BA|nr:uncharacterized protein LOC111872198 isoform X2 [Cryptotermes secundus]